MSKKYLNLLSETPLFSDISKEKLLDLTSNNKIIISEFKKYSVVHFDGEKCNSLDIILSGKVEINRIDKEGNLLTVTTLSDGDILGGNLVFSSSPFYPMTISTSSHVLIATISKENLFELLNSNPMFLKTYLQFVSDNASIIGNKIKSYVKTTIREKIITLLLKEYQVQKTYSIQLKFSKKQIAEKFGIQRTSLSRELKKMEDENLIILNKKIITLTNSFILKFIK